MSHFCRSFLKILPMLDIIFYLVGLLIACNLLGAWFFSNFPQHLYNLVLRPTEPVFTKGDFETAVILRFKTWGDLFTCPICLGTWMSIVVAVWMMALTPASWKLLIVGPLSWPFLFFLLYTWIRRQN